MAKTKCVLFCDDEPHIVRAAEFKFKRSGYEVLSAYDGEEAWELIEQARPDLLVTDCQMPRLDGFELTRRLRQHPATERLPVVMLTAKGFELDRDVAQTELGVLAVLAKPFSPRELFRVVAEILETGRLQREVQRPACF